MAVAALLLLSVSSLRHAVFRSNLYDLGIFDQAVYLISRGQPPIVTTMGFHILGDHGALILYPVALLYLVHPSVYWLFLIQAAALALGAWPVHALARHLQLSPSWARALALSYLLHPTVFNANLFDFHPEVIAVPCMLWAVWAAMTRRAGQLAIAVALILSCKDVLSLTVAMLGIWLCLFGSPGQGALLVATGAAWNVLLVYYLMPAYGGHLVAQAARYRYLGTALPQMALTALRHPLLVLERFFFPHAVFYYLKLLAPVVIGLRWQELWYSLPGLPMLALNVLSDSPTQRDLTQHYPIPIFPFLLVAMIVSLRRLQERGQRRWLTPRRLVIWSVVSFVAQLHYQGLQWLPALADPDHVVAASSAVAMVPPAARVLADSRLCPHLTERSVIDMLNQGQEHQTDRLRDFDVIMLDQKVPGWLVSDRYLDAVIRTLRAQRDFELSYRRDGIWFFQRAGGLKVHSPVAASS